MLRELLLNITQGKVYKRKLPQRVGGGVIYVSPLAALSYLKRDMDEMTGLSYLFDVADMFVVPGDCVWDIGANMGVFAFAGAYKAGRSGRVVAVEPDVMLVDILQRSRDIQSGSNAPVEIIPAAISDHANLLRLNIAGKGRAANYLETAQGSTQVGDILAGNWVCCISLDSLLDKFPAPSLIKIDVEGAELDVLKGASKIIAEYQPKIICEVRDNLAGEITNMLRDAGYVFYDLENMTAGRIDSVVYNTLAVPVAASAKVYKTIMEYKKR